MLSRLFRGSSAKEMPDSAKQAVEACLSEFCFNLWLVMGYGGQVSKENCGDQQAIFKKMESGIELAKASIDNLEGFWPAGKLTTGGLRGIANILPAWFDNFKAWQSYIYDHEAGKVRQMDKDRYQRYVLNNREYMDQIDRNFEQTSNKLLSGGIDLRSIEAKSVEKLKSDAESGQIS